MKWLGMPVMFSLILPLWGLLLVQDPPAATIISATEVETTLKQSIANKVVDQPIKSTPVPGGTSTVAMLHRQAAESTALVHDHVTETYQVMEGSGTLMTGGRIYSDE